VTVTNEKLQEEIATATQFPVDLNALLREAEANVSEVLETRDMDQVGITHALLEVANKRMADIASELSKLSETRSACMFKIKRHSLCAITDSVHGSQPVQKF
jgi:hypothetical protein